MAALHIAGRSYLQNGLETRCLRLQSGTAKGFDGMREAGIGRVLVASLHQAIADILPTRLGFYESWLSSKGMREGTIGLAPTYAVLSFLRQEGDAYQIITARAG